MKSARKALRVLRAFVRPWGQGHFNDEGRPTIWYAIPVLYMITETIAQVLYVHRIATTRNYFSQRPVQLMIVMTNLLVNAGCGIENLLHFRYPLTMKDFVFVERNLGQEFNYSLKFIVFDMMIVPILKVLLNGVSFYDWFEQGALSIHDLVVFAVARLLPEIATYIGAMYYCSQMHVFKVQLEHLRKSRLNRMKLSYLHQHLLTCVTTLHRYQRHQLVLCIFETVVIIIADCIFTHERFMGYLRGEATIYKCLIPGCGVAFSLLKLFNIAKTCHSVEIAVNRFVEDSLTYVEKKDKVQMDRALLLYLISKPQFNTSLGGYMRANLGLLITITSSIALYYLLMVQMNIIKTAFIP